MESAAAHRSFPLALAAVLTVPLTAADVVAIAYPSLSIAPRWAEYGFRLGAIAALAALIGTYARSNRRLVAELSHRANRDLLTGLPNTRAFEAAIERRLEQGTPFALALGDVDELRRLNATGLEHGDDALRRLADRLLSTRRGEDDVARVGEDEFAVLTSCAAHDARPFALLLERQLSNTTFGWASYPADGETALALFRAADERLYARKLGRGYRLEPVTTAS